MSTPTTRQLPYITLSASYLAPPDLLPTTPSTPPTAHTLLPPTTLTKLHAPGPPRTKDLRATGTAMQILSHFALSAPPPVCARLNDALHGAICVAPDRFAGMALLPRGEGEGKDAAQELQRCVTRFRFVGGVVGSARGERLDGGEWEALWGVAVKYRVPVALREVWPGADEVRAFFPTLPESHVGPLVAALCATHASSPLPLVQLYAAGVFDRHPSLRLILSRAGLTLASLLPRIETAFQTLPPSARPRRTFLDVWQHNVYVTTEEVLDVASMRALLDKVPMDRVLFATNYPFEGEEGARAVMEELRESGGVGRDEWARIAAGNAEALFGLRGRGVASKGNFGRPMHGGGG